MAAFVLSADPITVPAPALTTVLAILFLGEAVKGYQVITLGVVASSVYGLLFAGAKNGHA